MAQLLDGLRAAASNMAVQRLDEALLQAAEGVGAAPTAFTAEQIKWVTDKGLAKTTTQSAICKAFETRFNVKIDESTLSKYMKVYRCTGTYWEPSKRGPKPLLDGECHAYLEKLCRKVRILGWSLSAQRFRFIARGVVRRLRGDGNVAPIPGLHEFSEGWARAELERMGWTCVAATTDRTVAPSEVVPAGKAFYDALEQLQKEHSFEPRFVFNVDEWFVKLNINHTFTYEKPKKPGEKRNVAIADDKLGYTASALTSADGTFHLLQLIWKGKTPEVHARVSEEEENPRILQMHREDGHFQNETTWRQFLDHFVGLVSGFRTEGQKVLLVVDAATQHSYRPELDWLIYIGIPKCMTHVFQPADQLIIANLKKTSGDA
jgi:hypothetical protein